MLKAPNQHKLPKCMKAFILSINMCVGSHMRKVGSTGESKEGKVKDDVRMQETLKKKTPGFPRKLSQ